MNKTFQKLKNNPELWRQYWVREQVIDVRKRELGYEMLVLEVVPDTASCCNITTTYTE